MARSAYCGIDVGTQGVRVAVVDGAGRRLAAGDAALPSGTRSEGRHEQDPAGWWTAASAALRQATGALPADVEVTALALDATSGTVVVEGPDGASRGPALMYDDARAAAQAAQAREVGAGLWAALGHQLQPSWALPKVMWLLAEGHVRPGDRVVHQSDHLVRRLVGHPVATDTSHALKTGADLRTATWPEDLLPELGVPRATLPDLVLPGTVLGRVSADAARATGLPEGATVRAGMTDGCAAQIASGAVGAGEWSSALGTTLVVKGTVEAPLQDPTGAVYCHRHPDGGWLPGGASSTGAGALRSALPGRDLDRLTAAVRGRSRVRGATYPLVGSGERFPFVAPAARGFVSAVVDGDEDLFQALCEGIAYVERLAYDVLTALGADTRGPVALTGGSTANDWWNQLRTDVLARETVLPESSEAATGMAVLAASEPGTLSATARRLIRHRARLTPDSARGEELGEGYRELVEALVDRGWLDTGLAARVLATETSTGAPR